MIKNITVKYIISPTYLSSLYGRRSLWGGGGGGGGGGGVYFTVFDHPSLVSLLFTVLVSLHSVTF